MMRPTPQLSYGIERITSGGDHRFLFGRFVGRDNKIHLGIHSNAARRQYDFEAERWSPDVDVTVILAMGMVISMKL